MSSLADKLQILLIVWSFVMDYKYFRLFSCLLKNAFLILRGRKGFGRATCVVLIEGRSWVDKDSPPYDETIFNKVTNKGSYYEFYDKVDKETYIVDFESCHQLSRIIDPDFKFCNKTDLIFFGVRIIDSMSRKDMINEIALKRNTFEKIDCYYIEDFRSDKQVNANFLRLISTISVVISTNNKTDFTRSLSVIAAVMSILRAPLYELFERVFRKLKEICQTGISKVFKERRTRAFVFEFFETIFTGFTCCDKISASVYRAEKFLSKGCFRISEVKSFEFLNPSYSDNYVFATYYDVVIYENILKQYCDIEIGDRKYVFDYKGVKIVVLVHDFNDSTLGFYSFIEEQIDIHLARHESNLVEGIIWILERMCSENLFPCLYFHQDKAHASSLGEFLKEWTNNKCLFVVEPKENVFVAG